MVWMSMFFLLGQWDLPLPQKKIKQLRKECLWTALYLTLRKLNQDQTLKENMDSINDLRELKYPSYRSNISVFYQMEMLLCLFMDAVCMYLKIQACVHFSYQVFKRHHLFRLLGLDIKLTGRVTCHFCSVSISSSSTAWFLMHWVRGSDQ